METQIQYNGNTNTILNINTNAGHKYVYNVNTGKHSCTYIRHNV